MTDVELNNTLNVISDSCEASERAVRVQVEQKHQGADEEFITRLLHGELKFALRNATEAGHVSRAFQTDLTVALGSVVDYHTLQGLSANVYADSCFHKRSVESKTGGDFGLLVVRPSIEFTGNSIAITMAKQGLLCQAKLRHGTIWGTLTVKQQKLLKNRVDFVSLVLYSYADEQLNHLNPVEWQPCNGSTIRKMGNWLRRDSFPRKLSFRDVIRSLGTGQLGTGNQILINEVIAASNIPVIVVTIDWPDDHRPDPEIEVLRSHQQVQQVALIRH